MQEIYLPSVTFKTSYTKWRKEEDEDEARIEGGGQEKEEDENMTEGKVWLKFGRNK